tara:strand:- start:2650 stop:3315 length:666 start_codon:yes stop_codon:yes gene_type:complete
MSNVTWSHSALKDYEGCAKRYHEVKVLNKYPFRDTTATIYGKEVHKAIEDYINDQTPIPPEYAFVQDIVNATLNIPGRKLAEHEMALTKDLRPCDFNSPDRWVRGIADLLIINDDNLTARVVDWKTGNNKYPDRDQLRLMSLMVFAHFPHIREVKSALLFVVKDDMVKHTMTVDEAEEEWWNYRQRVAKLEASYANDVWNPTRTPLCGWCPVKDCAYNTKR